jgi:predicted ATPase with chaperone activity
VRAALKNCGYDIPSSHITINLAPADIRKGAPAPHDLTTPTLRLTIPP